MRLPARSLPCLCRGFGDGICRLRFAAMRGGPVPGNPVDARGFCGVAVRRDIGIRRLAVGCLACEHIPDGCLAAVGFPARYRCLRVGDRLCLLYVLNLLGFLCVLVPPVLRILLICTHGVAPFNVGSLSSPCRGSCGLSRTAEPCRPASLLISANLINPWMHCQSAYEHPKRRTRWSAKIMDET